MKLKKNNAVNRRQFLSSMAAVAGTSVLTDFGFNTASADDGDYKALVCMFFAGGMDHNDTLMPHDTGDFNDLQSARPTMINAYGSNRDRAALLPLNSLNDDATQGRTFALPPQMSAMRDLFDDGDLSFVGSVGSLIEPVTRATLDAARLPRALFSHNDQQNYFQGLQVEGAQAGWGGQFIDALIANGMAGNNTRFSSISTAGNQLFSTGRNTSIFEIGGTNIELPRIESSTNDLLGSGSHMDEVRSVLRDYLRNNTRSTNSILSSDFQAAQADNLKAMDMYSEVYNNLPNLSTRFRGGRFSGQFDIVQRSIRASKALGVRRQIFFIHSGGFDTHADQVGRLPVLQQSISDDLATFASAMKEIDEWNNVTVFSGSDFGRTLVANGIGSDHGWGTHQFVAGGSVKGQRIVGKMPRYDVNGNEYTPTGARLIPSVSTEQYAATLGRWFGVDNNSVDQIMPNLRNFVTRDLDLFS